MRKSLIQKNKFKLFFLKVFLNKLYENWFIFLFCILGTIFLVLTHFSEYKSEKINGYIIKSSIIQNAGPMTINALIEESLYERQFTMELPSGIKFEKGDEIIILKQDRFLLSPKYSFVEKRKNE